MKDNQEEQNKNKYLIEPTVNAASAMAAGKYSEALFEIGKIVKEYKDAKTDDEIVSKAFEAKDAAKKFYKTATNSCEYKGNVTDAANDVICAIDKAHEAAEKAKKAAEEAYKAEKTAIIFANIADENPTEKNIKNAEEEKSKKGGAYKVYEDAKSKAKNAAKEAYQAAKSAKYAAYETLKSNTNDIKAYETYRAAEEVADKAYVTYAATKTDVKALEPVFKYLPAVTELASARTKEDIKEVIDNYASPVGGWRLKQNAWMISFGAMVGGQISNERTKGSGSTAVGVFAPVGFDVATGLRGEKGGYLGGFFSILDVGNYITARFENDNISNQAQASSFSESLSLGGYLYWNIKESPFRIGAGVSYAPNLRTITQDNGVKEDAATIRYMLFLAIDVTMFPLW